MPKQDGWADLMSDAVAASVPRWRMSCGVARLMERQSAAARVAIESALANPDVTANGFRAALASKGVPDGDIPAVHTIQRHRKRECSCGKKAS